MIRKTTNEIAIYDQGGSPLIRLTKNTGQVTFDEPGDFMAISATNGAIFTRRDMQALHNWLGKALAK